MTGGKGAPREGEGLRESTKAGNACWLSGSFLKLVLRELRSVKPGEGHRGQRQGPPHKGPAGKRDPQRSPMKTIQSARPPTPPVGWGQIWAWSVLEQGTRGLQPKATQVALTLTADSGLSESMEIQVQSGKAVPGRGLGSVREGGRGQASVLPQTKGESSLRVRIACDTWATGLGSSRCSLGDNGSFCPAHKFSEKGKDSRACFSLLAQCWQPGALL